ncbi:unnamed protein product [Ectocarpus sp. CCAP 1310/34]|nr:unnamed protein product [Ectocarpus sp. CCAP 1310/34]CAB1117044.1 unnamed protein product [Ectocarpus sp. CCAP 1310/34]
MATNAEPTKTHSGRQTKPPAKYNNNGSLGAAVGGGGLAPTASLLPGFTASRSTRGVAVATNNQSEGGAVSSGRVAPTVRASSGKGKGKALEGEQHLDAEVQAIMIDSRFCSDTGSEEKAASDADVEGGGGNDDGGSTNEDSDSEEFSLHNPRQGRVLGKVAGGAGAGRSSGSSGSRSSSPVEAGAQRLRQFQQSLKRHRGRSYDQWAAYLLKEACGLRKISGYSRSSDTTAMAKALTQLDVVMERDSPYFDDLEDRATGGTAPSKPPASAAEAQRVPQHLIAALRAAINAGASPAPTKMYDCGDKSYTAAAIMEAMKEEDRQNGADNSSSIGQRRKSKHCVPRFCELLMHQQFRKRFCESRTQLSRRELDAKQTGTNRDIHLELWEAFKDESFEVPSSFADDHHIVGAGINPNTVHQPDITFQKFTTMRTELFKDHGEMYSNYKKSGSNAEMYSFCKESLDTYYFGLTTDKCPDILAVCDQMLPDGTASENTGVERAGDKKSGTDGAAADAGKRKAAKVESKERNAAVSGRDKKQKRQADMIASTAKAAMETMLPTLGLGTSSGPAYTDAPTSYYETKDGIESKAAKTDLRTKLRKELKEIKEDIRVEEARGDAANKEDLELLRMQHSSVRAQLFELLSTPGGSED